MHMSHNKLVPGLANTCTVSACTRLRNLNRPQTNFAADIKKIQVTPNIVLDIMMLT